MLQQSAIDEMRIVAERGKENPGEITSEDLQTICALLLQIIEEDEETILRDRFPQKATAVHDALPELLAEDLVSRRHIAEGK